MYNPYTGLSLALPFLIPGQMRPYKDRLLVYFLAFAPTFVILAISYEGLFYVAFSATLLSWIELEQRIQMFHSPEKLNTEISGQNKMQHQIRSNKSVDSRNIATQPEALPFRPLSLSHARVSLTFFVLLQSAFFSTGNVASLSSFSLESVYRLIPIFDPFSQGALLILKILIPFAIITANLGVLNQKLGVAPSSLFMLVMAISDILTLYFFWVVKDEGSWLEIGSTISHFAIASLMCVFVAALEGMTAWIMRRTGDVTPGENSCNTGPQENY